MRLCSIIPTADDVAEGAAGVLDRLGVGQVGPWAWERGGGAQQQGQGPGGGMTWYGLVRCGVVCYGQRDGESVHV